MTSYESMFTLSLYGTFSIASSMYAFSVRAPRKRIDSPR
jgi:hypothetical protein